MECHLTSSLGKGQPVLENKTSCCNQLLIYYLLHREDAVIVKLTKLITLPDGERNQKVIDGFRRFDNLKLTSPIFHFTFTLEDSYYFIRRNRK